MLCEKCGKNVATTHIHSVVNGKESEKHLCSECASKEGIGVLEDNALNGMLASMFSNALSLNSSKDKVRCKCCGSTFLDIANKGKAGCPECYKTFYNEFLPYIKRVHGSVNHIGKTLTHISEIADNSTSEIEALKKELSNLVSNEKFEQAAVLRDKIKELEAGK